MARHWDGKALRGPDPGIRLNYRVGRFIKSALPHLPWKDDYYYLQAQGYWVVGNWLLFAHTADERYRRIAIACSQTMLEQQRPDGSWIYPNPEWRGRIATVEGTWASIGLLETYRQTRDPVFLEGVLRWYQYVTEEIGFQQIGAELAVNYFAHLNTSRVPNNSILMLRFLAELADVTANDEFLTHCPGLITFLQRAQKPTGEFPYAVSGAVKRDDRPHFQCYQYNAFECLDLIRYHELTGDSSVLPMVAGLLRFLRGGLAHDGHALYQCGNRYHAVVYHSAVLAAACIRGDRLGFEHCASTALRACQYVLSQQKPDGGFPYSRGNYRFLRDNRSYPRYLAMILVHLLHFVPPRTPRSSAQITQEAYTKPL